MAEMCVGIDLGGTFIKFIATDRQGNASEILALPTPTGDGPEGLVEQMASGARKVMDSAAVSIEQVLGVGVGSPGPLDLKAGLIIASPNIGMVNVPL